MMNDILNDGRKRGYQLPYADFTSAMVLYAGLMRAYCRRRINKLVRLLYNHDKSDYNKRSSK